MKASKYSQATCTNDNDFRDYGNLGGTEANLNNRRYDVERSNVANSEELLLDHYRDYHAAAATGARSQERNANAMECKCPPVRTTAIVAGYPSTTTTTTRHQANPKQYNSEQNINFSCKLDNCNSASQFSLDRKSMRVSAPRKHTYTCEQNQKILQKLEMQRMRSPEVISAHRAAYDSMFYSLDNCPVVYDDYGFRRSFKTRHDQSKNGGNFKRRPAGDGMDSEMDDPELIFEMDPIRDCPCACDHVIYGPGYTTCLPDERFPPAPDVTRRLGSTTPIGKAADTPPYYRAASATNSSSTQSSRVVDLSAKHWWIIVTVLLLAAAAGVGVPIALKINAGASLEERLELASRLLQEVPLIDGHNDLPWNVRKFLHNRLKDFKFNQDLRNVSPWSNSPWSHTDLARLKRGHVSAQFWAAYVPCNSQYRDAVQLTLEQIDVIRRLTELYYPSLTFCTSSQDIKAAHRKSQLCSLIGVEGGHSLAGSLGVLRSLYHIGVRYLTLTSSCNTPWAECSNPDLPGSRPENGGLSNFGKTVVKEMNRLGMIVDLSHVSVATMRDALAVSKAPVIFSHSSAHSLCNSTRNVPDATLRSLALNKGVVMVNFYSKFLTCKEVSTVADAVAHINHIRDVAGVDNVGLGAGYDGINFVPQGLEDVSMYPTLFAELMATGKWTADDLRKLAGLNFLRVMQEVEKVRDEFKKANVPPYEDVLLPKPREAINCTSVDS